MRPALLSTAVLLIIAGGTTGCDERATQGTEAPLLVFGQTGMGPGEFSYPRAAAGGPEGQIYIVDKSARIQCYTSAGEFVRAWRTPASAAGKPTGLGVGPNGNLYVADTHYSRVLVFDEQGTLLAKFGSFGEGPGQFGLPTDVAVAADGSIYVSEYGTNSRISKFAPDYTFLLSFGGSAAGPARLRRPQSLLITDDGNVWVADACNHRICRFDPDGLLLSTFGRPGRGLGELRFPYGLDVLSDGTLVVTEYGNNRVQRFDPLGRSLGTWGTAGRKPGELAYPWAAVVVPGDRIVIVDSGNNRVQVIDGGDAGTWQRP